jgi:peptidoglycan/LPS O-acetylase OafA/YrhL
MGERAAVGGFLMLVVCVLARSIMVQAHAVAWDAYGLPIFEVAGALIVGAAVSSTSLAEALRHRTLVWVGGISYSLYLWHYPILRAAQETTRGTPRADRVAGYAVAVALTFFAAWASTRFVEQPFRRRRRTQLEPSADAPAVSAQTA